MTSTRNGKASGPSSTAACGLCRARDIDLFSGLTEADRQRMLERMWHVEGPAGTVLYSPGNGRHALYIIRAGLVKLMKYTQDGGVRIVRLARPGDVIGLGIIIRRQHGHTAQAMTPFEACRMPVDLVSHDEQRIPGLERKLFAHWQSSVEAADAFLTDLSTGTAHGRVARLLLYLLASDDAGTFPALSRQEIGATLGITTETASRVVAEFKRAGMLSESHDRFSCDPVRLRAFATP